MKDYSDLGLTNKFQSVNSLLTRRGDEVTAFDVDSYYDRNSIGIAQIRNFNFNQGTGGTLVLGGTTNGNGVFNLRNATGTNIVVMNNTGLTVNNGSITINNSSTAGVLDSSGIISNNNFSFTLGTVAVGLNQTIAGTADTPLTSGTLTMVLSRSAVVLTLLSLGWWMNGTPPTWNAIGKIKLNGTEQARVVLGDMYTDLSYTATFKLSTFPAGTNTLTVTATTDNTSGSANIYAYSLGYIVLGT